MTDYTAEEHAKWIATVHKYGTQEMAGCEMLRALKASEAQRGSLADALMNAQRFLAKNGDAFDPDKAYKVVSDAIVCALKGTLPGYEHNRR